jgi:hypothetical protein
MKKMLLTLAVCASSFSASAVAGDPCAQMFCLSYGPKTLSSECKNDINDYFKIKEKKNGDFSPSRTAKKRKEKVQDKCPSAPADKKAEVHMKYGGMKNNPFKFF